METAEDKHIFNEERSEGNTTGNRNLFILKSAPLKSRLDFRQSSAQVIQTPDWHVVLQN